MQGRSRIAHYNQPAKGRAVTTVRKAVLQVPGMYNWGPINSPTVCVDYPDFEQKFGGLHATYHSALAVKNFYDVGGRRTVIVRIVHMTAGTPTSAVKATHTFLTAAGGTYPTASTLKVDGLYYGTYGNRISVAIQAASNGEASRFDLLVYFDSILVDGEWYKNLSMLDSDASYVETVINSASGRSRYIAVTDLALGGVGGLATDERPANIAATALTGGNDGLTAIADTDLQGSATYHTGLYAFNLTSEGNKIICPDFTSTTAEGYLTTYCETIKQGKVVYIPDPPAGSDADAIIVHAQALVASESRVGMPWPRILYTNPDEALYGTSDTITIPPSGLIAGKIAHHTFFEEDQMWHQPGNEIYGLLEGAVGLETINVREPSIQDKVTDYHINPIVDGIRGIDGNYGVWLNDVQLSKTSGNFVSIGEALGIAYLRQWGELYLERHRTQNNTKERRLEIQKAFEAELLVWTQRGAFATKEVTNAFYVHTDPEGTGLNNPLVQDEQRLRVLVGVATSRPGRFVDLIFTRDNRAVESYLQQQLAGNS